MIVAKPFHDCEFKKITRFYTDIAENVSAYILYVSSSSDTFINQYYFR